MARDRRFAPIYRIWPIFVAVLVAGCPDDDDAPPADAAVDAPAVDATPDAPVDPALQWEPFGLTGAVVLDLHQVNGDLYAVTDEGVYRRHPTEDADWTSVGLTQQEPQAMVVMGDGDLLVSTADPPGFHVSDDGGESWTTLEDDFGGEVEEVPEALAVDPDDGTTLYATGAFVVARSTDGGTSWEPLWGDWGSIAAGMSAVDVHPVNGDLWAGGQNAIEDGVLVHSTDGGEQWEMWSDLAPRPSTVKDFAFHPTDGDRAFVGMEAALLSTPDRGDTWVTSIDAEHDYRFFFGVEMEPEDPDRVYAAGWIKEGPGQPLVLFISDDGGEHWTEHEDPDVFYGGVVTMLRVADGDDTLLYLGLDGGGVHRVRVPSGFDPG